MIIITFLLIVAEWLMIKLFAWLDKSQPDNDAAPFLALLFLCLNAIMAHVPNALGTFETFMTLSVIGIILMIVELIKKIKQC